jgi:hypothetical protein
MSRVHPIGTGDREIALLVEQRAIDVEDHVRRTRERYGVLASGAAGQLGQHGCEVLRSRR